ncbi:GFA family protein [Photobacterium sp. SDRW27]|uniref:GFA family protein n=1 Tax=Photobacterium obscurum TaxID=2829490 RepID=UPI002242EC66|nr:GFA family protein [Photobacterium obscurum]MCW8331745.1 GFA family protein [Photobacterium obscurum]
MFKTHRGSCHCGFIQFEIDADIDHIRECNCSICYKRGALNFCVEKGNFRLITPISKLKLYQWYTKTAEDYFCPHCGILPFRKPSSLTKAEIAEGKKSFSGWAVNVRCLEGLNIDELPLVKINGAHL